MAGLLRSRAGRGPDGSGGAPSPARAALAGLRPAALATRRHEALGLAAPRAVAFQAPAQRLHEIDHLALRFLRLGGDQRFAFCLALDQIPQGFFVAIAEYRRIECRCLQLDDRLGD
jgi:hypothetical protein